MSWAIPQHHFHPFPRLHNMIMFKLLEIHDLGSKGNTFCRRKILSDKSIFGLVPRIDTVARQRREPNFFRIMQRKRK